MRNKKYLVVGTILILLGIGIGISDKIIPKLESGDEYSKIIERLNSIPTQVSVSDDQLKVDKQITRLGYDFSMYRNLLEYQTAQSMAYRGAGSFLAVTMGLVILIMVFLDNRKSPNQSLHQSP